MANYLESLGVTNIFELTNEQIVSVMNKIMLTPNLIILFIFMSLIFLIVGLMLVKRDKGRFMNIWFFSTILSAIGLLFLIFSPNTIFMLVEKVKMWFN